MGTKAYSLAVLAAFDAAQLPLTKLLGEECLKQIQDLQIAHWGTEHVGILQEDTIQTLIMGANRLLDFLLSMERTIIDLHQSALQVYNIALGGQACGKLLDLLENIFGYPKTKASRDFEASLQPHSLLDPEEEPEAEAAIRATDKPGPSGSIGAEMTTESRGHHASKYPASGSFDTPGKGKAFRRLSSIPIEEAVAFLIISEKAVTMTGISSGDLLIGKATKKSGRKGKQSIYRCQHCGYVTEQKAQGATHVRSEHLGHCLQCCLCNYHTFRLVDFKPHLISKHPGRLSEWYEPLPDLSDIVATDVDPKDIIIGVKEEPTEEPGSSSESDEDKEQSINSPL